MKKTLKGENEKIPKNGKGAGARHASNSASLLLLQCVKQQLLSTCRQYPKTNGDSIERDSSKLRTRKLKTFTLCTQTVHVIAGLELGPRNSPPVVSLGFFGALPRRASAAAARSARILALSSSVILESKRGCDGRSLSLLSRLSVAKVVVLVVPVLPPVMACRSATDPNL
jgi:hypothetical protein